MQKVVLVVFLLVSGLNFAQETHYWFHNFGAISSLKGGIEVGGIRNVAAAYYNPGALAFIDGEYFEGQADVVSMDVLNIKNAGGDMINLDYLSGDISPSMVAYLRRSKKNPKFTYVVGAMTRYNSNLKFNIEHEQPGNYLSPASREDIFQGQLSYDNRVRESWVIGSVAYKIADRIGLGLGTYFFIRSQDYVSSYAASAFPRDELGNNTGQFSVLTSADEEQRFNSRVIGFVFKPAIDIDLDALKLGITLTTPSLSLGLLNNYASRAHTGYFPDENTIIKFADSNDQFSGVYKTPFSASIGAEYDFGRLVMGFSMEYFAKIDTYEMIKPNSRGQSPEYPSVPDEKYGIPVMAHKSVTNYGFSARYEFKEWISLLGSFRTDLNYFDDEALNRYEDFVPNFTYWDLYHITAGIKMSSKKLDLTVGVDYANGSSENDLQFVSMTSATQANYLRGNREYSTTTQYHNLSFTIGINLNIENEDN